MTLHHAAELAVAGGVVVLSWLLSAVLRSLVGGLLHALARPLLNPLLRRLRPPLLTGLEGLEKDAEERERRFWAEILAEARSRTPVRPDPDPHLLKLSRIPAP
jgi:hypothetical protein